MTTQFEVTHVGSLPRSQELAQALIARDKGEAFDDTDFDTLVTTELEEAISRQVESGVGPDRVIASTDCGFGTFAGYGKIDAEVTWKKLGSLRQGADIAATRQ